MTPSETRGPLPSLGFGIERVGLAAVRYPWPAAIVLLVLVGLSAFGVTRVGFDQDLRSVFGRNNPEIAALIRTASGEPDPDGQVLVLVEGPDLAEPATFQRLRDFQIELLLTDGVGSVLSPFSLRQPPAGDEIPPSLVTDPDAGLTPAVAEDIRAHPLLGEKLLSADRQTMLFIVLPRDRQVSLATYRMLHQEISVLADDLLGDTGLTATVTGFPALRIAVVDRLIHDQLVLNAAGALVGWLLNFIVFRSLTGTIITALPAIIAGLSTIGMLGVFGINITVMSNVVPALVMILGYADGMHLSDAFRRRRLAGMGIAEAELAAMREVGPATILTALTTSVAFLSLTLSDVSLIQNFGWIGAVATFASGPVVLVGHAVMVLAIGRFWRLDTPSERGLIARLIEPSRRIGGFAIAHARAISALGVILLVVCGALYASVPPEQSIREHLPTNDPANAALGRVDSKLGGAFPIRVIVPLHDTAPTSPEGLARVGAIHKAIAEVVGSRPLSLWSLVEWLGGDADAATGRRLDAFLARLDDGTRSRIVGARGLATITVSLAEAPTHELLALLDRMEAAVSAAGGDDVLVSGSTVISARGSTRAINSLNLSLCLAVLVGLAVIALAFRSARVGVIAFLPNVLPIVFSGALIFFAGKGLQFTSVIALTVAFGVAVDDTVHYLNRIRLQGNGASITGSLLEASAHVGPVIIGSTLILIAGLSTTLTSSLPTVTLFGQLVALTLVTALIGDLVFLPALMSGPFRKWFGSAARPGG